MARMHGEILGVEKNVVTVAVRLKDARPADCRFAIMLDGRFAGSAAASIPARARRGTFAFPLPAHAIASRLDVCDLATGLSILDAPFNLESWSALAIESLTLEGHVVHGRFRVAADLDPVLPILLLPDLTTGEGQAGEAVAPIAAYALRRATAASGGPFTYEFEAALPALCPLDQSYELSLAVAGATPKNARTLAVDARAIGYVGYIDRADSGQISGWAADFTSKTRRLKVDLVCDGAVIASTVAEAERADVKAAGFTDGKSAFIFTVPPVHRDDAAVTYSVKLSGTETHFCNSPTTMAPSLRLIGFFDEIEGGIAVGWICDMDNPKTPLEVEIVCGDAVLARVMANGFRGDVVHAGIPSSNCGFRVNLGAAFRANLGREVFVRPVGLQVVLNGSPKLLAENPNIGRFLGRSQRLDEARLLRLKRRLAHRAGDRAVSIVMPVYNTRRDWLIEALESVRLQWCDNWELICVDDNSTEPHVSQVLAAYTRHDPRFRVMRSPQNVGIARATNFGIRAARHDYVTFMDHDDFLEPDAVYLLIRAIAETGAEFIYSDEVLTYEDLSSIMEVRARPQFSYDYYLSHPYFVHMLCVKTAIAQRVGGWDEQLAISADVDFVLRVLEVANAVAHVPVVLYRWRTHATSTGHAKQSEVMDASIGARVRHLARSGIDATVSEGVYFNQFRVDWPSDDGEILIVIPTRNKTDLLRTCIDSIERTSKGVQYRIVVIDHQSEEPAAKTYLKKISSRHTVMPYKGAFNFARMNNVAVRKHGGDSKYILFLNNDIEAKEPGWLDRLRSLANRHDVGAVGPLLMYGDKRVQHAGVIIGFNNAAEHAMKFADTFIENGKRRNLGYNCTLSATRDFSAVTAACLLMRRDVFEEVGGFDEIFAIGFNDTDLCLRVVGAGYKVLYDGSTLLFHHESATRSETKQVIHPKDDGLLRTRWKSYFSEGDPFYNPNLDIRMNDHTLRTDGGCRRVAAPRVVKLVHGRRDDGVAGAKSKASRLETVS